jgi:predicted MFS family arabinose efflux permease
MLPKLKEKWTALESNVRMLYIFTLTYYSTVGILKEHLLSGFIFVLTNSNKDVGLNRGITGLFQLCFAIPSGFTADKFRRDKVLKAAGVVGLVASAISIAGFWFESIKLILVAFAGWGIFNALHGPASEALFADCFPQGQRSLPCTVQYVLMQVALIFGPALSTVILYINGNRWELTDLKFVLIVGAVLSAASLSSLFFFIEPEIQKTAADSEQAVIQIGEGDTSDADNKSWLGLQRRHVPYLLMLSEFIISNGAGMTISFFPIFFFQEYGLAPTEVNFVFIGTSILVIMLSMGAQSISTCFCSRMQILVSTRFIATVCLVWMSFAKPLWLQISLFLVRGGTMRATVAIRKSILMDHVPRKQRGRWNSFESLIACMSSASSVVGGYLIDAYSYRFCFRITAAFYFVALLVDMLLLSVVRDTNKQESAWILKEKAVLGSVGRSKGIV